MPTIFKLTDRTRNTEVNAVIDRISKAFHSSSLNNDAQLAPLFAVIDPLNLKLTDAVKRMKAESDLEAKDEVRDAAYQAFYYFVSGNRYSTVPDIRSAATTLFLLLKNYALGITTDNYDTESSELDALLLDLAKPEALAAIGVLPGCAALITDLQTKQNEFKAARLQFQEEQTLEKQQLNATQLKRDLLDVVNKQLVVLLNGLMVVSAATYGEFAQLVATVFETSNETVKKRQSESAGVTQPA